MPVQKQDISRALALLKEYHGQLTAARDKPLQAAMGHVISVFKGHLFEALLDVQEYYEMMLLNDVKSVQHDTLDFDFPVQPHMLSASFNNHSAVSEEPLPLSSPLHEDSYRNAYKNVEPKFANSVIQRDEHADRYSYEEILLDKGTSGLGFSVAGGTDVPHVENDSSIYVTKVIPGGTAYSDGRLRTNDIIISINGVSSVNITHAQAVDALKKAGRSVQLVVKRLSEDDIDQNDLVNSSNVVADRKNTEQRFTNKSAPTDAAQSGDRVNGKISRDLRKVILQKGPAGFGFNIVGGEDGEGIYVSSVMPGGPADVSGQLHKGDQLISVNGIDIREATHEQAAAALKGAGEVVEIALQFKPNEFRQFETKINDLREQMKIAGIGGSSPTTTRARKDGFFARALFDYIPPEDTDSSDRILSVRFGDVFHVLSNVDEEDWWQAAKVFPEEDDLGYIPSKKRVETNARMNLKGATDGKKKKNKKSKKAEEAGANQPILSYQTVTRIEENYVKPLIVLGSLKDKIYDALITEFPDAFGSCIPHTTRPKKDHEVDGRDYHFVTSREQMEQDIENHLFVEAGQYSENLYGTSIQSVKDVAENGKHCILDIGVNAIVRLQSVGLYPITIFIKPKSTESLMQWGISQEEAQEMFKKAMPMENEFKEHFTAIVVEDTPDAIFQDVKRIIQQHSGPFVWIPSDSEKS